MATLYVVGLGPGAEAFRTLQAQAVLERCAVIVGYPVYLEQVRASFPEKTYLSSPMTKEAQRVRLALDAARSGQDTALVCSGDSGVYGLAALCLEMRGACEMPDIEIVPGVTAAVSGAARLGAPLTGDFACVSLSDRLVPWEVIERRLRAAAAADFVLVLYNPGSHARPAHLQRACAILREYLPDDRVCAIVRQIGREGETQTILPLRSLAETQADMFSTVWIGSSATRVIQGRLVTARGYPAGNVIGDPIREDI